MPAPSNERVGALTASGTAYRLNLAADRPAPYRPSYRLVWPEYQDVPGAEGKVSGDPSVRQWFVSDWSKGEGKDLWEPGFYDASTNVRPKATGAGLTLGAYRTLTVDDNGTPATFTQGARLGFGLGSLWACTQATVHEWQPTTGNWDETGTATGAAGLATSICDGMNGTHLLIGTDANEVEKVAPGGANSTIATGLAYDPVLRTFGATPYCLVGDDLYPVKADLSALDAVVSQPGGSSVSYLTASPIVTYGRLSTSDKGPIWFQRLDSGQTYIWEYNVANDTTERVGRLPVDFAFPYSIYWAFGFIFVGFRAAGTHAEDGDAYIYFQRGSQQGAAGPVRRITAANASTPVLIAGTIGDDLIFYFDGAVWGYSLSTGGIFQLATSASSSKLTIRDAVTFGRDVFISNVDTASKVERFDTDKYSTDTATLNMGRSDLGYLGVSKTLLEVKVVTEPLPALTSVTLKRSTNGGAWTTVTGTHDTDDATAYTWTVSSSTTSITGEDFGLQVGLASTSSTATPTIRSVTARAVAAEKQRGWVLELDVGTFGTGRAGYADRSSDMLAAFRSWAAVQGIVKFTDPWDGEEWDAPTDYEVVVEQALLVESESEGDPFIQVQLREVCYV